MRIPEPGVNNLVILGVFSRIMVFFQRNTLMTVFFTAHILFAGFLGNEYAVALDEGDYVYTFNNLSTWLGRH
jgi:hypothetical protein